MARAEAAGGAGAAGRDTTPNSGRGLVVRTWTPEETEELGAALGRGAFPGAVVLLDGPLGSGKTVLARGVARGLGASGTVTSPSFTLLAMHAARLPLFHLDLYRIAQPGELRSIDLDEIFDSGGVVVVEWPRWLLGRLLQGTLEVEIQIEALGERRLELRARDPRWEAALASLSRDARRDEGDSAGLPSPLP